MLGEEKEGIFEITNSYAIPFDENNKQQGVWFIDNVYHEEMYKMYRKINVKEKLLGWYVTGKNINS
jgi:26S proteasome regulatory subunit N8